MKVKIGDLIERGFYHYQITKILKDGEYIRYYIESANPNDYSLYPRYFLIHENTMPDFTVVNYKKSPLWKAIESQI